MLSINTLLVLLALKEANTSTGAVTGHQTIIKRWEGPEDIRRLAGVETQLKEDIERRTEAWQSLNNYENKSKSDSLRLKRIEVDMM